MNRAEALGILYLPKDATLAQIEENYNQLREFYHPDSYGCPHEFTPQQIQEHLYEDLSGGYYKEPKGIQYKDFIRDAYHHAFLNYVKVCRAYDYLTDPANQNQYNVDPNSHYGRDVMRFGRGFANFRRAVAWLFSHLGKPVLIIYLISGLLSVMGNRKVEVFNVVCDVSRFLYLGILTGSCILFPTYTLLALPRGVWANFVDGFKSGPWLLRPFKAAFMAVASAVIFLIMLVCSPGMLIPEPDDSTAAKIKKEKDGRAAAEVLYRKTLSNVEGLHKNGYIRISDDMPCIRKALEALAAEYERTKTSLVGAQASGDMEVYRAEKNFNLQDRVGWLDDGDTEDALNSISKARDEREKAVDVAGREFRMAGSLFHAFAHRVDADPEKYIKE